MRRALAPDGHRIAAIGGHNKKTPKSGSWQAQDFEVVAIPRWGAIGSPDTLTIILGGVQFPGAPSTLLLYSPFGELQ